MFAKKSVEQLLPYKVVPQEVWKDPQGCLKLDWNEATLNVSPSVKKALKESIDRLNLNWYPNVHDDQLISQLASYVGLSITNVMYFASSDSAQEYIARTFLESFDDVLIVAPTYDNFRVTCQSESYHIHFFYMDKNLEVNLLELDKDIKKIKPKLVYISNPNNPTGTCYTKKDIEDLLISNPNVLFLVDEAYIEFSRLPSNKDLVKTYSNIIITRTFSKAFGLAGFRIGYILSHKSNLEFIGRVRNPKSVTSLTLIAAKVALDNLDDMWNYVKVVLETKKKFLQELSGLGIPYKADGGNFVLIKIKDTKQYISYLRSNKIYVRDYTQMVHLNGYDCRITIGNGEQMDRVLSFTKTYLKSL